MFYGFILILQPVCDSWSHSVSGLNKAQGPFAKLLRNVLSLMKCVSSTVNRAFMELNESEFSRKLKGYITAPCKYQEGSGERREIP